MGSRPEAEDVRDRSRRRPGGRAARDFARRALAALFFQLVAAGSSEAQRDAGVDTAQAPPGLASSAEVTGPSLDRRHWAVIALRRAGALGLVDSYLPSQRSVPAEEVGRGLREASARAAREAPRLAPLLHAWYSRLLAEFPGLDTLSLAERGFGLLGARVDAGVIFRDGAASPGTGEFEPDRSGAIPITDMGRARAGQATSVLWGDHLGLSLETSADADGVALEGLELAAGWGWFRSSVGRVPVGYAHGFGGSVLMTGEAALDIVQVGTRAGVRLPGVLRHTGPVSFHTFLGRMWEDRHPDEPFIWGAAAQLQPHRRFTLGVHRAAFFGGDSEQPVTFKRVLDMLIGRVAGIGFENQIVSVSGRLTLPTERIVPLEMYLEWGAEDAAGAWFDVPGRVMGIWSPALPFWPAAALGVEYASFATSCCSNPSWYRHWSFPGAWASGDRTLGHRVGGDGTELMAHLIADLLDGDLHMRVEALRRDRRAENLFSPGRTGVSWGGSLEGFLAPADRLRLQFGAAAENGEGWTETNFSLQGAIFF